jgi:large subunit ribosomal protein L22
MEVRATAKYLRVQPRKVRIIADEVKGMPAAFAAHKLRYHTSKSAKLLRKVLINAMANAAENHNLSVEELKIARIEVNEGPRTKRIQARAMGRANRIVKKTSHITVVVEDVEAKPAVKEHGTKAKARPTFAAVKGKKKAEPKAEKVEETVVETVVEQAAPAEENGN